MTLQAAIIFGIMVAIIILPFALFALHERRRKKERLNDLMDFAKQEQSTLTHYDISGRLSLGLDENSRKLFFLKKTDTVEKAYFLDLKDILFCEIECRRRVENLDQSIATLRLIFKLKNHSEKPISWEFFDLENDLQLRNELRLAEKWAQLINQNVQVPLIHSTAHSKMSA